MFQMLLPCQEKCNMFLIITPSFYPSTYYGGPSLSVYNFALAYAKAFEQEKILVLTTNADGKKQLPLKDGEVTNYHSNFSAIYYSCNNINSNSLSFFKGIIRYVKSASIVYIVSVFSLSTLVALYASFFYGKKIVLAPKGQIDPEMFKLKSAFIKKLWLFFFIKPFQKKIIWHVKSEYEKKCLQELVKTNKVIIASNGYWFTEYDFNAVHKLSITNKFGIPVNDVSFLISSISRLHYKKGFDILITAMKTLIDFTNDKSIVLIIAGPDNGEKNKLLNQIEKLKLQKNVFIIDTIQGKEKVELLKSSDCFTLASRGENFGQVYLEALACGTPIISTNTTPWQHVEEHGIGYCTLPDVSAVFEKMLLMYERRNNIDKIKCKKYAEENFAWPSIVSFFRSELSLYL